VVADAEHELDLFVTNPKLLTLIGEENFLEGVEARQRALDEAREQMVRLSRQSTLAEELVDGDLLKSWPSLSVQDKRRLLHGLLDRVVVSRARPRTTREPRKRADADRAQGLRASRSNR
jgi:hypothetical protein